MFDELGEFTLAHSHSVLPDENLAGSDVACADTDSGDCAHRLINAARGLCSHHFEKHAECASFGESACIRNNGIAFFAAALHPETAESMFRLRGETDVCDNRNTCTNYGTNPLGHSGVGLDFDSVCPAFFHEARRRCDRLCGRLLVTAEGEIGDHHSTGCAACYRGYERNHLVKSNGESGLISVDDISGGVTDKKHIDSRAVKNLGC